MQASMSPNHGVELEYIQAAHAPSVAGKSKELHHGTKHPRRQRMTRRASIRAALCCEECPFAGTCIAGDSQGRSHIARQQSSFEARERMLSRGEQLTDVLMLRKGSAKTCVVARDGREQITCFHFPGELIGLEAFHAGVYAGDIIALEYIEFCRFSLADLMSLSARAPHAQRQLLDLMSQRLNRATQLAADLNAEERLALFLLDMHQRIGEAHGRGKGFKLVMSRTDIASHLRLASETVSRVLSRFRKRRWVDVSGRTVKAIDSPSLERLRGDAPACH
jgi:CRP/FNR family transcriptional regulator, anaerobic regulatory protein